MPRIGSFGHSIRIKYKLELDHVIRVPVNKHVLEETKIIHLPSRHLDVLTVLVVVNSKFGRTKVKESSYLWHSFEQSNLQKLKCPGSAWGGGRCWSFELIAAQYIALWIHSNKNGPTAAERDVAERQRPSALKAQQIPAKSVTKARQRSRGISRDF